MLEFVEVVDRDQVTLFPERLEDWIGEDHLVKVVDLFVDRLDLVELGFAHGTFADRSGDHPSLMLKLFIYGYLNRIPSCRRLEREAECNVEVMWLLGGLVPDHKTIADFRRDAGAAIRKTCAQFVELCHRIGTLKGDCVAIDGSKFKAVNNRDKNFTKGKIASRLAHLEADVERYITELVRIDRQEEGEARAGKVAHLAEQYGRLTQEIEKLKEMDKAWADAPDGQISLTDPDARAMATSARNSELVGYNAECAVDTETHIPSPMTSPTRGLTVVNSARWPWRPRRRLDAMNCMPWPTRGISVVSRLSPATRLASRAPCRAPKPPAIASRACM